MALSRTGPGAQYLFGNPLMLRVSSTRTPLFAHVCRLSSRMPLPNCVLDEEFKLPPVVVGRLRILVEEGDVLPHVGLSALRGAEWLQNPVRERIGHLVAMMVVPSEANALNVVCRV